jgi:hypothetical protein
VDQQELERVERTNKRHENNRAEDLPPIRKRVAHQAYQLPHRAPETPHELTGGGIGMGCKGLFYFGRWPFVVGYVMLAVRNHAIRDWIPG